TTGRSDAAAGRITVSRRVPWYPINGYRPLVSDALRSVALLALLAGVAFADDGPTVYAQICASCHDAGYDRAPDRAALRSMSPERVLAALETGPMISMTDRRSAAERRAVAEFVTGKS